MTEMAGQHRYIGLDNWKVGRTAAWAVAHACKEPGKVAIMVGGHRFRSQEMNESGFRSYFREHDPQFTVLEALSTFETSSVSQEITEKLLTEHPDVAAIYVAGGGITGVLTALRNANKAGSIVVIAHDLMDVTRAGLIDHSVTVVISHPLGRLAGQVISKMVRATSNLEDARNQTEILPFDIFTSENV
jgi:LacI family transcriptional regulator